MQTTSSFLIESRYPFGEIGMPCSVVWWRRRSLHNFWGYLQDFIDCSVQTNNINTRCMLQCSKQSNRSRFIRLDYPAPKCSRYACNTKIYPVVYSPSGDNIRSLYGVGINSSTPFLHSPNNQCTHCAFFLGLGIIHYQIQGVCSDHPMARSPGRALAYTATLMSEPSIPAFHLLCTNEPKSACNLDINVFPAKSPITH